MELKLETAANGYLITTIEDMEDSPWETKETIFVYSNLEDALEGIKYFDQEDKNKESN